MDTEHNGIVKDADDHVRAGGRLSTADAVVLEPPPDALAGKRIGDFADEAVRRMLARSAGTEKPLPVPWPALADALAGGMWPGAHVLVGNTGAGKTQFALELALAAARAGNPVIYIGLELDRMQVISRLVALDAGASVETNGERHRLAWSDLYTGKLAEEQAGAIFERHLPRLAALPLYLEHAPPHGWRHDQLGGIAEAMRQRHPEPSPGALPGLVVLDFLQLVSGDERELRERISRAAYACRAAANNHNLAVLMLSSTSRENYTKLDGEDRPGQGNPARLVGAGKESGDLEFAADSCMVLVREPWASDKPPSGGTTVHLAVAKLRAGTTSWQAFRFDGNRFREHTEGAQKNRAGGLSNAERW